MSRATTVRFVAGVAQRAYGAADGDLQPGQLGAEHRPAYSSGRCTVISRWAVDRPTATRPLTVMVFEPWLRRAEKVDPLPRAEVVVLLTTLMYRPAAAGEKLILARWPRAPGL